MFLTVLWSVRAVAATAIALGAIGCQSSRCDNPYAAVHIAVPGGQPSISSYHASDACTGDGTAADCRLRFCGRAAVVCACDLSIPIRLSAPQSASTANCHVEVTSFGGDVFAVDVPFIVRPGQCPDVLLADPDHSTFTVDFADGGTRP